MAEFTDKPWNGSASKYGSTAAYCASCLIDENGSGEKVQSKCHLPVKEPGGAVNKNALRNAAARLNQVQASSQAKARARSRLASLMKQAGIQTSLEEDMNEPEIIKTQEENNGTLLSEIYERIKAVLWAEDEPVEEAQAELQEDDEEEEVDPSYVYQLPYEDGEVELTKAGLYKKVIMKANQVVHHAAGVLDHSKEALGRMVENFKGGAFDQVPLLTHHPDEPKEEIFAYLGEMVDLDLEDDNLVGYFRLTKRGEEVVRDNPNLPTSPGYIPDYERKADKRKFGPTLQHIATVFKPHLHGLGGWEPVKLSAETEVVDLTDGIQSVNQPRKEAEPVSKAVNPVTQEEEVEMTEPVTSEEQVTLEQRLRELENKLYEREANLEQASKRLSMTSTTLRRQGIRKMLHDSYVLQGVPPAKADAAFVLLAESKESDGLIVLSADGDATVKTDQPAGKAILELLEGYKGTIEFAEKGKDDVRPADAGEATHQRVMALVESDGITYREAMDRLKQMGEVTL